MSSKIKTNKNTRLKFKIGEKILCYEKAHLYDAKCVATRVENKEIQYLVHFNKWKSKYDTWVSESRLLKYNDKNIQLQLDLRQKVKDHPKSSDENEVSSTGKKTTKKSKLSKTNSSESSSIGVLGR